MQEDAAARENGSGSSDILEDVDSSATDAARTKAAIEHIQGKIDKIMRQIKEEQTQKEGNTHTFFIALCIITQFWIEHSLTL